MHTLEERRRLANLSNTLNATEIGVLALARPELPHTISLGHEPLPDDPETQAAHRLLADGLIEEVPGPDYDVRRTRDGDLVLDMVEDRLNPPMGPLPLIKDPAPDTTFRIAKRLNETELGLLLRANPLVPHRVDAKGGSASQAVLDAVSTLTQEGLLEDRRDAVDPYGKYYVLARTPLGSRVVGLAIGLGHCLPKESR